MAGNTLVDIFRIKDLRDRILFTLGALVVFRIGCILPVPGINLTVLKNYYLAQQSQGSLGLTEYFNFFSGGAFDNFSIFMMSIMPYITVGIIIQILALVFPKLKKIMEEPGGRRKINRYTRIATVPICFIQSFVITRWVGNIPNCVSIPMLPFTLLAMMAVTTGTIFLMWLGEQINQRGIGNGVSLLIFAGIIARMPNAFYTAFQQIRAGSLNPVFFIIFLAMFVVVIGLVVYEQQGQRKIPVNYAKRVVGRKMYGAQNSYIPMRINPSGVIPVIFASSVLQFPLQIVGNLATTVPWLAGVARALRWNGPLYQTLYALLIIVFAFFYTQVTLNPFEIAKNIREHGGSIPGIRSEKMEEYLTKVLNRIILPGSLFLAFIAIIPSLVQSVFNFPSQVALLMGGTSLLILVGVDLDTMAQIEGQLKMHHHDGLVKKGKIRSRNL